MLAVKYYQETADELKHYYIIYTFQDYIGYPIFYGEYMSEWSKDLSLDELRKATGNHCIDGIIHTKISAYNIQEYEARKIEYLKFADKEFKKGKSIEQIDAEWAKQQKIDAITESAKEYTCDCL